MCTEVDVFISNYTLVDPEIYELWVEGNSASEAVSLLNQRGLGQQTGATLELIASDVLDHYRTYSLLEKLLSNPNKLQEQLAFQIEPHTRQLLIEKYYEFDDSVIRELLGKKLSSRHRKDLDEVSEKTGVPLKSCRRQFDNVKRIFKVVEELPGSIVQNIQKSFFVSEELAKRYACIVFIGCLRFETSKRRLQYLTFPSLKKCIESIMEIWTYSISTTSVDYFDTEMDKEFLLDLRELRILMEKEKEHKHLVCTNLKPKILLKNYTELDNNFRIYSRAILTLATSLHRARELRNLFVELSQIIDLLKQGGWNYQDLELFLISFQKCAIDMDVLRCVSNGDLTPQTSEQLRSSPRTAHLKLKVFKKRCAMIKDIMVSGEERDVSETGTQTMEKTNINIISNVRLSQATLNTILSEVMKDMIVLKPNTILPTKLPEKLHERVSTTKKKENIEVKEHITNTTTGNKIVKYTVGNVTSAKRVENDKQNVYRETNLNRTSSLEVNTSSSSPNTTESESDDPSLIDSLEGSPIPKKSSEIKAKFDDKPVRGDMYFVVDSCDSPSKKKKNQTAAFFVPIESKKPEEAKPISELFPEKLKEKIDKRQAKRDVEYKFVAKQAYLLEKRKMPPKSDVSGRSANTKSVLPSIGFETPKVRHKSTQCKPVFKNQAPLSGSVNCRAPSYKKIDPNRVQILEIMECVDGREVSRKKSRIPRLVRPKLPKINGSSNKKPKIDYTKVKPPPNIDRLIANILINTINADSVTNVSNVTINNYKRPYTVPTSNFGGFYGNKQEFEVIPENADELSNSEKATQTLVCAKANPDSVLSMPKGWVTFYSTRKDNPTSDSSSDDGFNTASKQD